MRAIPLALAAFAFAAISSRADDQIPLDVLNKIKAATVFIKVNTASGRGSGSGFLITVERDKHFVITNEHVVVHDGGRAAKGRKGNPTQIEIVFHSGADREETRTASIVVTDPVNDLAVLRFEDGRPLGDGLDYSANVQVSETLPVCMVGFPFGKALAASGRNPSATIGRGSVSSIRDDKVLGKTIQIDGDLNPGNSGGPVVDSKGRLIGVAVAKISGTNIGFAVPIGEIIKLFEPRIPLMKIVTARPAGGQVPVRCELDIFDPAKRIKKLEARYVAAAGRAPARKAETERTWPELPDSQVAQLNIAQDKATGTFQIVTPGMAPVKHLVQLVATYTDNSVARSEPLAVSIEASRTTTIAAKERVSAGNGRPVTLIEAIRSASVALGTTKVHSIKVDLRLSPTLAQLSNDGRWLYYIGGGAVVHRLTCPDLKEDASEPTYVQGNQCLTLSAVGVVVSGFGDSRDDPKARDQKPRLHRTIVLDFNTLKPLRTIEGELNYGVASSPSSNFAYALLANKSLAVYDLTTGAAKIFPLADLGVTVAAMKRMVVSPDNKWLLACDDERIYRLRIDGPNVKLDEKSPPILRAYQTLAVSHDGKWIHAGYRRDSDAGAGARVYDGNPNKPFDLYSMDSLAKAAVTWTTINPGTRAAFDRKHNYVYANTGNSLELQVFDLQGRMVAQYETGDTLRGWSWEHMLVDPEGRYVAYLADQTSTRSQRIILLDLRAAAED